MPERRACHMSDTNEQVQRGVSHGLLLCMHAAKHGHATIVTSGATPEELWAAESRQFRGRFRPFQSFFHGDLSWHYVRYLLCFR